jgi:hypothetical protein
LTSLVAAPLTRRLNHVELVYAPGERGLATRALELLGCRVEDMGGPFLTAYVGENEHDIANNVLYASEVTAEQWAFEKDLSAMLAANGPLAETARAYLERLRDEPQRSCHFGLRFASEDSYEQVLERLRNVAVTDPELGERLTLSGVFRPGDPGAYSKIMIQAFVRTDVLASGLLSMGQHFELQWQLPRS